MALSGTLLLWSIVTTTNHAVLDGLKGVHDEGNPWEGLESFKDAVVWISAEVEDGNLVSGVFLDDISEDETPT